MRDIGENKNRELGNAKSSQAFRGPKQGKLSNVEECLMWQEIVDTDESE